MPTATIASMLLAAAIAAPGPAPVTFGTLLSNMTDRPALARLPYPPYTCRQFSSYDRGSVSPDDSSWWANADAGKFLREEDRDGRTEWVMMDAAGPGAIVRIWSANPKGTLRVYLDGAEAPVIEAPMAEFLGGAGDVPAPLSAVRSRGYNLYLPVPYAGRCVVTSDEPGFYYQINYRTYPRGTQVESFTPDLLGEYADLLQRTCRVLTDGARGVPDDGFDHRVALEPGERTARATLAGSEDRGLGAGSAVTGLTLRVQDDGGDVERALREVVLTASFDGEETIWCPAGDFFGSGVGLSEFTGFYRRATTEPARLSCDWVMPFEREATIGLENRGDLPVQMDLLIGAVPLEWTDHSMHFHARWRAEHPIHTRAGTGTTDWNYVTIEGEGVYVGDTLAIMNPIRDWWGEGDEKIYIDGESFPSHFGTGTEDYYGYAWCCPDPFQAPFHAQPRCDGHAYGNNWGHATVTRTRALDAIPFTKSLRMDMEVWHWKEADVAYAATTYFYARPGATHNRPSAPEAAAAPIPQAPPLPPPFKIEGAIEAEAMKIRARTEGLVVSPQGGFSPGTWSGEEHLWARARKPGDFIELEIPAPNEQPRRLLAYLTRSFDYGIVALSVNDKQASEPIDTFNTDARWVDVIGPIDLGAHAPADGLFVLRIESKGANERSEGAKYFFGIDCVVLAPTETEP